MFQHLHANYWHQGGIIGTLFQFSSVEKKRSKHTLCETGDFLQKTPFTGSGGIFGIPSVSDLKSRFVRILSNTYQTYLAWHSGLAARRSVALEDELQRQRICAGFPMKSDDRPYDVAGKPDTSDVLHNPTADQETASSSSRGPSLVRYPPTQGQAGKTGSDGD